MNDPNRQTARRGCLMIVLVLFALLVGTILLVAIPYALNRPDPPAPQLADPPPVQAAAPELVEEEPAEPGGTAETAP